MFKGVLPGSGLSKSDNNDGSTRAHTGEIVNGWAGVLLGDGSRVGVVVAVGVIVGAGVAVLVGVAVGV